MVEDKIGEYLDDNIVELIKNNLDDVVKLLKDKL